MRIVRYFPNPLTGTGGVPLSAVNWSEAFAAAGHDVVLAHATSEPAPPASAVKWVGVPHRGSGRLVRPVGLENVLDGADLLVLHSAWTLYNIAAAAAARKVGLPYVLEPRGGYNPSITGRDRLRKTLWWHALERRLVDDALAVHIFDPSERGDLTRLGYRGPVIVARNGVTPPPGVRWDGGSGRYLLWLGRFDPEHKGLDLLVRALLLIPPDTRPQLRLHGTDWNGSKERFRGLVSQLNLDPWVIVGEAVYGGEKWDLLARAAGFVYPSRWEAYGNSPVEAASIGVPTLTTGYPIGRFLAERGGALQVDATPEAIAHGITMVLSPDSAGIGETGARVVRDQLSWPVVAETWVTQAEKILARIGTAERQGA